MIVLFWQTEAWSRIGLIPSTAQKPHTRVQRDIHKTQSGETRLLFVWE
jgi:hypothetical protein